jgi:tetratricopeptide (TPR) repeat protein
MQINNPSNEQQKMTWHNVVCLWAVLFAAVVMSGCAATSVDGGNAPDALELLLNDAKAEVARGRNEEAIRLLKLAAKEHPTRVMPWLKMAEIWFDDENYPSSIMAANEVLRRDARNQGAKSLLVVAGLRVAAGAVSGLRPSGAVGTATRVEAEDLTNSLRGMLGEKDLVPAPDIEAAPVRQARRPRPRPEVRRTPVRSASPTTARRPTVETMDPFRSLK